MGSRSKETVGSRAKLPGRQFKRKPKPKKITFSDALDDVLAEKKRAKKKPSKPLGPGSAEVPRESKRRRFAWRLLARLFGKIGEKMGKAK